MTSLNRHERRAKLAQGLSVFLFFRRDAGGKLFFYPVEIPADQLDENIRLNPGTVKVEDNQGNLAWREPS
jgi:hypothetical protein